MPDGVLLLAVGGIIGALALLAWWLSYRRAVRNDVFSVLGITSKQARAHIAPPPIDLGKPIATEDQWNAIRRHAADSAYRQAVETIRLRYQIVGNPMLLPNTLKQLMHRSGFTFRDAVIRTAEDDGLHGHR